MSRTIATALLGVILCVGATAAQDPPPPGQGVRPQRQGRANQLQPPAGPMTPQQVQELVDGWALVESQRALQLTDDQTASFVQRYLSLQRLRRRFAMERQRTLRELPPLLQSVAPDRDAAIGEKLKALDDLSQRTFHDVRKALTDLDAVLTAHQRARFRVFEENLERRKIELLGKVGR
jgi:hypothetical protein